MPRLEACRICRCKTPRKFWLEHNHLCERCVEYETIKVKITENLQARINQCAKKAGQYAVKALRKEVGAAIRIDNSCDEREMLGFG